MERADDRERARLTWRCRRGMKELDLLLLAWLDRHWHSASRGEREAFAQILDLPDPELASYLLGNAHCSEGPMASLVASLQQLAVRPAAAGGEAASRSPG